MSCTQWIDFTVSFAQRSYQQTNLQTANELMAMPIWLVKARWPFPVQMAICLVLGVSSPWFQYTLTSISYHKLGYGAHN